MIPQSKIDEIKRLGQTKTTREIASIMGFSYNLVYNYLGPVEGKRVREMKGKGRKRREKVELKDGFFNEHERENWLV